MSEPVGNSARDAGVLQEEQGRLAATIRQVKNDIADRDDVVVDIREAQLTRLEILAEELKPVFAEVPHDDDWFDFVISSGTEPRLWIDAVAHVTMARDRRTYRFLRDSRLGRVVMAESSDIKPVAEQVTRYIAERIIERQRAINGDLVPLVVKAQEIAAQAPVAPLLADPAASMAANTGRERKTVASLMLRGLFAIIIGGLVGAALVLIYSGTLLERIGAGF